MERVLRRVNVVFFVALIITSLLNICFALNGTRETINSTSSAPVKKIHIIIDPGHGGIDPGTAGSLNKAEAPINLAISKKLMSLLEGSGFIVEMTRYDDVGLYTEKSETTRQKKNEDLTRRVELINESQADIAISIHLNSFPQKKYYGAHVFYKKNCDISKIAADVLQNEMKDILDNENSRVPQVKKDIRILDHSTIPTILIECGFLSNVEEESNLISEKYQEKIAWSIYTGLIRFFNETDDTNETSMPTNDAP